ncbi:MAG: TetR/AcrR family transcriptional regulator [Betaproteobacteria bacterium]|nr:TetR/AcrR family transcriptional regulator [Betaproteobacteria bacterium]NDC68747.1 TetR/AcrR family transcriptional regulator [Betaproteobacteria bacterium]
MRAAPKTKASLVARIRSSEFELQRDRLAEQAVRLFAVSDYASASMAAIAQACSVSKATLYHYFQAKDDLLFHALDRYTNELESLARLCLQSSADRCLEPLITQFVQAYADAAHYHKALLHDVHHLPCAQREQIRCIERQIVKHFQQAMIKDYPALEGCPHLGVTSMSLLGMLNFSFTWWRAQGTMSREAFAAELLTLWRGALEAKVASLQQASYRSS